jgi:hypothetical protein
MRTLSLALATLATAWLTTRAAQACTSPNCTHAVLFPSGGNIPADHLRLLYFPSADIVIDPTADGSVPMPLMYRLEGSTKVNVPYTTSFENTHGIWLIPTTEQPLGTQLVVETQATSCEVDAPMSATYSVTEARPTLPSTLGTLKATTHRALIPVAVGNGACSDVVDVSYADVSIDLSSEAQPFASLFRYSLYVDDVLHPNFIDNTSASYRLQQGHDRIYAQCSSIDAGVNDVLAVKPGVHVVHFAAQMVDERPLVTPDIQIELRCDGKAPTGSVDGGVGPASSKDDSCALASAREPGWFALLLLGLVVRRRRVQA